MVTLPQLEPYPAYDGHNRKAGSARRKRLRRERSIRRLTRRWLGRLSEEWR